MRIGIDIGGSHIAVGLVDESGNVLAKQESELQKENLLTIEEQIMKIVLQKIDSLIEQNNINKSEIQMIGVACCSDSIKNNIIMSTTNLDVKDFELGKILQEKYQIPVFIKNDAKCAAIAEKEFGCLQKYENAIFLTIGTGIGGAAYYKNQLLQPDISDAFEVGHMIIKKYGKQCNCGNKGCFERYASIRALKEMVKEEYNIKQDMTGVELYNYIICHKQEEKMKQVLQEYIEYLCIGIANILRIYKAEAIGLGGSFVYYKDIFLEPLRNTLKQYTHHGYLPKIEIAMMKNDAGIIGASRLE